MKAGDFKKSGRLGRRNDKAGKECDGDLYVPREKSGLTERFFFVSNFRCLNVLQKNYVCQFGKYNKKRRGKND